MKQNVIEELNHFLKGNYMAIHAYDNYIHHIKNNDLKRTFQEIQQNHKEHANLVAERIQDLGGKPVDDVGMMGSIAEFINNLKGPADDPSSIIQDALVGERRGIEKSKAMLEGDLDPESLSLVKQILKKDQRHVELLDKMENEMTVNTEVNM